MSPHTSIILLLKPVKKNRKDKKKGSVHVNKKVDELHMKTKCPKQLGRFLGEENH
jgi:hypothetical protein